MGNHPYRSLKSDQIPGIGRLITDPADQTLQVINRPQIFPYFFPVHFLTINFLYGIQTPVDRLLLDQRLLNKRPKHPGSHGGFGFIQHPEKRPSFFFFPHSLCQLQVSPGRAVDQHILIRDIRRDLSHMLQRSLLSLQKISEESPCRNHCTVIVLQSKPFQRTHMKMFL